MKNFLIIALALASASVLASVDVRHALNVFKGDYKLKTAGEWAVDVQFALTADGEVIVTHWDMEEDCNEESGSECARMSIESLPNDGPAGTPVGTVSFLTGSDEDSLTITLRLFPAQDSEGAFVRVIDAIAVSNDGPGGSTSFNRLEVTLLKQSKRSRRWYTVSAAR